MTLLFPFSFPFTFLFVVFFFYSFFFLPHIIFFGCIGFMGISIYIYIDVLTVFLGWCSFFFFFFFFFLFFFPTFLYPCIVILLTYPFHLLLFLHIVVFSGLIHDTGKSCRNDVIPCTII